MQEQNPIRPTDDEARALACKLIQEARFGAIAVTDPDSGCPYVARVAVGQSPAGEVLTLISDLAHHTRALRTSPDCSLLLGEPKDKGDALVFPRITLMAKAEFLQRDAPEHPDIRARYLKTHPKSQLYIDFADFNFVKLQVTGAHLNGGFGKAFILTPEDLRA